jgi:hypothetical protein
MYYCLTDVVIKRSIFWDIKPVQPTENSTDVSGNISPPSSGPKNKRSKQGLLTASYWLFFGAED